MDPTLVSTVAAGIVTALVPYLTKIAEGASKDIADLVGSKLAKLYESVKAKLQDKPAGMEAVKDFEANPQDVDAQAALRLQLKKLLEIDREFMDEVSVLLEGLRHDAPSSNFLTTFYGSVEKVYFTTIGSASNVAIGDHPTVKPDR